MIEYPFDRPILRARLPGVSEERIAQEEAVCAKIAKLQREELLRERLQSLLTKKQQGRMRPEPMADTHAHEVFWVQDAWLYERGEILQMMRRGETSVVKVTYRNARIGVVWVAPYRGRVKRTHWRERGRPARSATASFAYSWGAFSAGPLIPELPDVMKAP